MIAAEEILCYKGGPAVKRILALCACLLVLCAFPLPALAAEAEPAPYTSMPETTPDEEEPAKPPGMLESTAALGQALFSGIWNLFDNQFPGFNFTFRQFWIAVVLCGLSIRVIRVIFSFGGSGGESTRSSSTRNPKISKERRHDEF